MNGYEIAGKYEITVVNHSMFLECSEICKCGHHAKHHKDHGSAGICTQCEPWKSNIKKSNPMIIPFCHNFIPEDSRTEVYKDWLKREKPLEYEIYIKERAPKIKSSIFKRFMKWFGGSSC